MVIYNIWDLVNKLPAKHRTAARKLRSLSAASRLDTTISAEEASKSGKYLFFVLYSRAEHKFNENVSGFNIDMDRVSIDSLSKWLNKHRSLCG